MTWTASVANRPEYCLTRRSKDSGTESSSSSDVRALSVGLSVTPKSYAMILVDSSNRRGVRRCPCPRMTPAPP